MWQSKCSTVRYSPKKQGTGTALDGVLKEIGVMKKLRHPNCVQLYEVIDDATEDALYMVMEFCAGGPVMPYDEALALYELAKHTDSTHHAMRVKQLQAAQKRGDTRQAISARVVVHRAQCRKGDEYKSVSQAQRCRKGALGCAHDECLRKRRWWSQPLPALLRSNRGFRD